MFSIKTFIGKNCVENVKQNSVNGDNGVLVFESGAITRDLMTAKVVKFKYFSLKRMLFSGDIVIRYNQVEVSL